MSRYFQFRARRSLWSLAAEVLGMILPIPCFERVHFCDYARGGVPRGSGWKTVMLVDFPDLLTAAKLTAHLVFDPRCLCGDKPFACLDRTNGLIHFQLRNVAYRVVEALRKSCINSTRINPEHTAPPEFRSLDGHPSGRLLSAHAGVVALKQVDRFGDGLILAAIGQP